MAKQAGARVLITAGSAEKIARCTALGADAGINYKEEDFAERVMELTDKAGVELVQDFIGAAYWDRNLRCLKVAGRMVMVGLMGGIKVEANLNVIMGKRLRIMGSVMRSQPLENKIAITRRFQERWLPLLESGVLKPVIDTSFPLAEAAAAHRYMEENRNVGKILLTL
jgi:NADPH:quinone reductase-like Zn-dependent oxidoreductase